MTEDLWPDNIADSNMVTPVSILKEQAALLGEKTRQLVKGEVVTQARASDNSMQVPFTHRFFLAAPTISYRYELFYVTHGVNFYPLNVAYGHQAMQCRDEEDFKAKLKTILSSPQTINVVHAILAQVRA